MNIWSTAPFFMVIYLAALQDIPRSLYEAAEIDGANAWGRFRFISVFFEIYKWAMRRRSPSC